MQKWQEDNRFRAKIKLLLYGLFIILVTMYAISLKESKKDNNPETVFPVESNYQISIPDNYSYFINITIDGKEYIYSGEKHSTEKTINKTIDNVTTNYLLRDNDYYMQDNNLYVKITKEEVYDIINYNYIDLNNINNYLNQAIKDDNQYKVYLQDVILDTETKEYFVISINDGTINIDYTPLMKRNNPDIESYNVSIQINEIEWKRWKEWKKRKKRIKKG